MRNGNVPASDFSQVELGVGLLLEHIVSTISHDLTRLSNRSGTM
jgi:hypothetical protein